MDNPLEQPTPQDPITRVKVFARDLAYGALHDYWGAYVVVERMGMGSVEWMSYGSTPNETPLPLSDYLTQKWDKKPPTVEILRAQGYLNASPRPGETHTYYLTQKAFDLLDAPVETPSVFISYKRSESSALGLLVEARLKLVDPNISVFIDKQIEPGDDWENVLRDRVQTARVFVALIAPETLSSVVTRQEIDWALESEAAQSDYRIVQICHGGYTMSADNPLGHKHAILVQRETAEDYDRAISQLVNTLGYSTL